MKSFITYIGVTVIGCTIAWFAFLPAVVAGDQVLTDLYKYINEAQVQQHDKLRDQYSQVKAVVKEIEAFVYIPDPIEEWDRCKPPQEFMADGGGDCEDLTAFVATRLINRGLHKESVGLLFVVSSSNEEAHVAPMFFSYNTFEWWVLDNEGDDDRYDIAYIPSSKYQESMIEVSGTGTLYMAFCLGIDPDNGIVLIKYYAQGRFMFSKTEPQKEFFNYGE